MNNGSSPKLVEIKRALKLTRERLSSMTPAEQKESLIRAGILTKSGRVSKPYVKVIK